MSAAGDHSGADDRPPLAFFYFQPPFNSVLFSWENAALLKHQSQTHQTCKTDLVSVSILSTTCVKKWNYL